MTKVQRLAQMEMTPYPGKTCGGCTACCHVVPVRELGLKAWQGCPHVLTPPSAKLGCSIYPERPPSCRAWACGWLTNDWPADMRPDRLGVIVDPAEDVVTIDGREMVAVRLWVMRGHEEDWNKQPALALILGAIDAGFAVLWDLPPGPDGVRYARALLKNAAGKFTASEPTPAAPTAMTDSERYWRAQQMIEEQDR